MLVFIETSRVCSPGPLRSTTSRSLNFFPCQIRSGHVSSLMKTVRLLYSQVLFTFLQQAQLYINSPKRLTSIPQLTVIRIHLIHICLYYNSHKAVICGTAEGQTGLPPLGPQTCPNRTESSGSPFCPTFTLLKCSMNTQPDNSSHFLQIQSGLSAVLKPSWRNETGHWSII